MWADILQLVWIIVKILIIVIPLMVAVAYSTYLERKVMAYMHVRIGPNRVGLWGLLQPIADALKLVGKELIRPTKANPWLFLMAPILVLAVSLAAWSVIPFSTKLVLANIKWGFIYFSNYFIRCVWNLNCGLGIKLKICFLWGVTFLLSGSIL